MQGLHVVPEALGLLDFCQELIHLSAAADLGVVGTISHPVVTWLSAVAEVGNGRQPRESLGRSGMLFKAGVINRILCRTEPANACSICTLLACSVLNS